jgi:hypothetical protein
VIRKAGYQFLRSVNAQLAILPDFIPPTSFLSLGFMPRSVRPGPAPLRLGFCRPVCPPKEPAGGRSVLRLRPWAGSARPAPACRPGSRLSAVRRPQTGMHTACQTAQTSSVAALRVCGLRPGLSGVVRGCQPVLRAVKRLDTSLARGPSSSSVWQPADPRPARVGRQGRARRRNPPSRQPPPIILRYCYTGKL